MVSILARNFRQNKQIGDKCDALYEVRPGKPARRAGYAGAAA